MKRRKKPTKIQAPASSQGRAPITLVSRGIAHSTRLVLFVRAGGRCEFNGCNEYLLEHPLTLTEGNFGQMAHIVAFSKEGPRGRAVPRPEYVNDVNNLMLLCPPCHKLIDDNPERWSVETLEKYKTRNEERIRHVTGLGPDLKTTVVQLKCRIAGQSVAIPISQVTEAVAPRYPTDTRGYVIDLTAISSEDDGFIKTAAQEIDRKVSQLYESGVDLQTTRHISLFALAPVALLVHLGNRLSNKIPVDAYQRHRDTEDWVWKVTGTPIEYKFERLQMGSDREKVALLLSLSGKIRRESLPAHIDAGFTVYEITQANAEPSPMYLRLREDLTSFREIYQTSLRSILRDHGSIADIHLFPAVPAPVAVTCGRELFPKVDPSLIVYDYHKKNGGFTKVLEVN